MKKIIFLLCTLLALSACDLHYCGRLYNMSFKIIQKTTDGSNCYFTLRTMEECDSTTTFTMEVNAVSFNSRKVGDSAFYVWIEMNHFSHKFIDCVYSKHSKKSYDSSADLNYQTQSDSISLGLDSLTN